MKRWTHFAHHHSIAAPPPMFQPVNGHARLILEASPPGAVNAKVGVGTTALHLATATGKHWLVKELTSDASNTVIKGRQRRSIGSLPRSHVHHRHRLRQTRESRKPQARTFSSRESHFLSQDFLKYSNDCIFHPWGVTPRSLPPFPGSDSWHSGNTRTHSLTNNVKTHKHM